MKARTLLSICLISGLAAAAQTAPPSQKVAPDTAKSPSATPAVMRTTPAPAPTMQKKASPMQPKPMTKPMAKPAVKQAAVKAPVKQAPGKRDPFVSPIREGGGPTGPECSVGKKCLAIASINLLGIVRAQSGSIAVVESSTRKVTYFLRESDPVFNGYVVKITGDSVMFRENVVDRVGKQTTRDIVKRVSAPAV